MSDSNASGSNLNDAAAWVTGAAAEPAVIVSLGAAGAVALRALHADRVALTHADYQSWWIVDGLVVGRPTLAVLATAFISLLLLRTGWTDLEGGGSLRAVAAVAIATLAIGFSLYSYNSYLDRWHFLDRVLVAALAIGAVWRLALLPAFTLVCYAVVGQFSVPLGSYSWTDKIPVFEVLWAIQIAVAWQVVSRARRLDGRPVLVAVVAVMGARYLSAGVDKLRIGWLWNTDLSNLVKSARVEGWLRWMPLGTVEHIAAVVGFFNPLLLVGTLAIEIGCVLLLFTTPRLRLVALSGFIVLHVSIFLLTGIFFWKWIAVDAALIVVLVRHQVEFRRRTLMAGFIVAVVLHAQVPVNLAWVDSPVTHVFSIVAVDSDGEEFVVPERYFAPFQLIFNQDRFGYLTDEPLLANAYGTLDRSVDAAAIEGLTRENYASRRDEYGVVRFSEIRSMLFDEFIRAQCHRWVGRTWIDGWPLVPPPHIWTTDPTDNHGAIREIDHVLVRLDTWILDDLTQGPLDTTVVRRVSVDSSC